MSGSNYENFGSVYQIDYDTGTKTYSPVQAPTVGAAVGTTPTLTAGEGFTEDQVNMFGAPYKPIAFGSPDFTYLGVAEVNGTVIGFIAQNQSSGSYYLFTEDSAYTPGTDITIVPTEGYNFQMGADSPNGEGGAVCFRAGTMIATPDGDVAVETIKIGDVVSLSDGGSAPVTWLGIQTVSTKFADPLRVLPVRIKANALGDGMPARDLLISPDHAILLGDILVQAGALVNGVSITRETDVPESFIYYHVEVADHSLILAENVPAETFVDNVDRMAFDNWAEHQALYGDVPAIAEMAYPRAKAQRQVPLSVRNRLLARAHALYGKELATAA